MNDQDQPFWQSIHHHASQIQIHPPDAMTPSSNQGQEPNQRMKPIQVWTHAASAAILQFFNT